MSIDPCKVKNFEKLESLKNEDYPHHENFIDCVTFEEFIKSVKLYDYLGLYPLPSKMIEYTVGESSDESIEDLQDHVFMIIRKKFTQTDRLRALLPPGKEPFFAIPPYLSQPSNENEFIDIDEKGPKKDFIPSCDANVIMFNLLHKEINNRPLCNYMSTVQKKTLTPFMRAVLIDWLADVNNEFRFHPETLFLCVNFIDRFLSAVPVRRGRLQLLGITSLFVAAKFEESVIPPVKDSFLWACDSSVTSEELMKMEQFLLNTLHFSLCAVTPHHFIHRFLKATAYASPDTPVLAFYYLELSLLDHSMLCFLPSEIAASSVWLACFTTLSAQHRATLKEHTISQKEGENVDKEEMPFSGQGEFQSEEELYGQIWTPTLEHYTSHTLSELVDCIVAIHHFANSLAASPNLHLGSITIKYSRQKYLKVAERYPSMPDLPKFITNNSNVFSQLKCEKIFDSNPFTSAFQCGPSEHIPCLISAPLQQFVSKSHIFSTVVDDDRPMSPQ